MIGNLLAVWAVGSAVAGIFLCLVADSLTPKKPQPQPEPDWLWDAPTDVLSDEAVNARFAEIVAHFRVLS